ncbi:MAG: UDP-N-acetylmuramate--L-alanine ligase [Bacillota bacterium]|nr:UDP-N-acetylmuramate--L-alanine ligase [Bacillota bacterium]
MLEGKKWFHFIGIGGIGMSALAFVLIKQGHKVTGSDLKESEVTKRLQNLGIVVHIGHNSHNICNEVDVAIVSTAINNNNPELKQCQLLDIPVVHRGELLAEIFNPKKGIAVAGAHGKTTTTAMLGVVLEECKISPTVLIGGDIDYFKGNAKVGTSELIIAEADESDGSFLKLQPHIGVITNIEDDHLDYYGTIDKLEDAFLHFIYKTSQRGIIVVCTDDKNIEKLTHKIEQKITYGLNSGAVTAKNIIYEGLRTEADIYYEEQLVDKLVLNVPGEHNLLNALAVIGVGIFLGLNLSEVVKALAIFKGVKRRFEKIGEVKGAVVVDDYAHHPTEILATLAAAKKASEGRVVAIFQPHRYSRTKSLYKQFAQSFKDADVVIFDEIYSAGEAPISNVSTGLIVAEMDQPNIYYCNNKEEILQQLNQITQEGDLIITLGAGDVWKVAKELVLN